MKVLIIGANGFLGSNLIQKANLEYSDYFSVIAADISNSGMDSRI